MRWNIWLAFVLFGCGGAGSVSPPPAPPPPPPPAPVASVTISPSGPVSLLVGGTAQLLATPKDAQGATLTGRTVTWTSTGDAVATVSTGGLVTGISAGSATIRAASEGQTGEVVATVTPNPWNLTGPLLTGRTLHTATLLSNGKVLVVGGQNLGPVFQVYAGCELYDPATGTWSPTGSLTTARENHIAVRLQNGKVLVAGGQALGGAVLKSSEVYDPVTGTWSATGDLGTSRMGDGLLLPDGRVLVAGGSGPGALSDVNAIATSEIYSPATGTWTATGALVTARSGHTLTLLANGKVLAAGGASGSLQAPALIAVAELFDPIAGTWSSTGSIATPRSFHRAVLLGNGLVAIVGGSNYSSAVFTSTELYDAANATWSAGGNMGTGRISHSATLLPSGKLLVVNGFGLSGPALKTSELYDPVARTWSAGPVPLVGRGNHAAVLLASGRVLVVGGQPADALSSAEIFDPAVPFPGALALLRTPARTALP